MGLSLWKVNSSTGSCMDTEEELLRMIIMSESLLMVKFMDMERLFIRWENMQDKEKMELFKDKGNS